MFRFEKYIKKNENWKNKKRNRMCVAVVDFVLVYLETL